MQLIPQRGKDPIETTRENVINKLRNMIVTRQVVVKFLPGPLEVDRVDHGRTPRPILSTVATRSLVNLNKSSQISINLIFPDDFVPELLVTNILHIQSQFIFCPCFSMQNTTHHQCSKSTPISTLLCDENDDKSSFLQDFDENPLIICTNTCYFDPNFTIFEQFEDDDHHINILLQREISSNFIHKPHISANSSSFFRNYAISYIFHMGALLGFQLQTTYLSVCYFDLFLSKRSIDEDKTWEIQLVSIACLLVAAKMEEIRVPSLSKFQVGDYKFEPKSILRMEFLLLDTLEWKMGIITPFAYLPCFMNKLTVQQPSKALSSTILKLILAFLREINSMDHHPYAIAIASIFGALDTNLSRHEVQLKINAIPFCKFLDIENILTCYNKMLQIKIHKIKVSK
ncbi:cyclin-D5-1-like [Amaranthus tricolor]|uniref:cyclin-D5-1-like n=1 Tax=Amaranthus tricolor TaxID=29722 RepID=UPI00258C8E0D|nr:cyclin-D5-1-like [Amaranthus tricolor]